MIAGHGEPRSAPRPRPARGGRLAGGPHDRAGGRLDAGRLAARHRPYAGGRPRQRPLLVWQGRARLPGPGGGARRDRRRPARGIAQVLELRAAGLRLRGAKWNVAGLVEHDLLSLAAEDEAEELVQRKRERLARRLVDVEIDQPAERIRGERDVLVRRGLRSFSGIGDERQDPHALVEVGDAGIADAVLVVSHVLRHGEDHFLEDDVVAPFPALSLLAQHALADELLEAVPRLDPVDMERLGPPLAAQAQIGPVADGLGAAVARGRIDGVDLLEGELLDGVVLVDEKRHPIQRAEVAIRAPADRYAQRIVSELRFEIANVVRPELA